MLNFIEKENICLYRICTYRGNFLLAMCTYSVNFLTGCMLIVCYIQYQLITLKYINSCEESINIICISDIDFSLKSSKTLLSKKCTSTEPLQTKSYQVMRTQKFKRRSVNVNIPLKHGSTESKTHIFDLNKTKT